MKKPFGFPGSHGMDAVYYKKIKSEGGPESVVNLSGHVVNMLEIFLLKTWSNLTHTILM